MRREWLVGNKEATSRSLAESRLRDVDASRGLSYSPDTPAPRAPRFFVAGV